MLLPWLILIPFIGGLLCWQTERFGSKVPRWIALISMGLTLALSLQLWLQGGYSLTSPTGIPQWQSEFSVPWIPRFGISFHLALDGLSLLMVVLTGADPLTLAPTLAIVAVLTLIKWALNLIIWLTILMALLSWLNPRSPAMPILYQLTAPFLNPLRRVVPQLGGIDLSPILLFVIVQVLLMVVTRAAVQLTYFVI